MVGALPMVDATADPNENVLVGLERFGNTRRTMSGHSRCASTNCLRRARWLAPDGRAAPARHPTLIPTSLMIGSQRRASLSMNARLRPGS